LIGHWRLNHSTVGDIQSRKQRRQSLHYVATEFDDTVTVDASRLITRHDTTREKTSHMGMTLHVRRAAIWTLGHKSKKPTRVDAYVDGEYCAKILANSITNCRTSRVWRDPLSPLLLLRSSRLLLLRSSIAAAATQQHCCCTVRWRGQTSRQRDIPE